MDTSGRRFEGRVAVVSGAASGIGAACAARFASEGAAIASFDVAEPSAEGMKELGAGGGSRHWVVDVRDEAAIEAAVGEAHQHFGRLDVLLNAAGVATVGDVASTAEPEWDRVLDVNLKGTYLMSKHVVPHLVSQGSGSVVNLASVEGLVGFQSQAAYNSSKGGVVLLTRNMAIDYAEAGVRVNCLCPGLIETPMTAMLQSPGFESIFERFVSLHPMKRPGRPAEVAAAAAFLASDDASFITGVALPVDGGLTAGHRFVD